MAVLQYNSRVDTTFKQSIQNAFIQDTMTFTSYRPQLMEITRENDGYSTICIMNSLAFKERSSRPSGCSEEESVGIPFNGSCTTEWCIVIVGTLTQLGGQVAVVGRSCQTSNNCGLHLKPGTLVFTRVNIAFFSESHNM